MCHREGTEADHVRKALRLGKGETGISNCSLTAWHMSSVAVSLLSRNPSASPSSATFASLLPESLIGLKGSVSVSRKGDNSMTTKLMKKQYYVVSEQS